MSKREVKKFRVYDRFTPDYDILNSFDDEAIEIASPPIRVFSFNILKTVEGKIAPVDELYNETNIIDEAAIMELYKQGFNQEFTPDLIRPGEMFDPYIEVPGFYQEPEWTQELSRLGIDTPEELAVTFNYGAMLSKFKKEIKIGDVIQTFRGKIYRIMDAYVADEIVGWKYIHFHVIAKKPDGLDTLILPGAADVPVGPSTTI